MRKTNLCRYARNGNFNEPSVRFFSTWIRISRMNPSSIYLRIITSRLCGLIVFAKTVSPSSCRIEFTFSHFIYMYIYEERDIPDKRSSTSRFSYTTGCGLPPRLLLFMASRSRLYSLAKFYILFDKFAFFIISRRWRNLYTLGDFASTSKKANPRSVRL